MEEYGMNRQITIAIVLLAVGLALSGCSTREVVTGAAAGGAAYEYSNKRAMDELKDDYDAGRISYDEYERRKRQIEERSLVY
jgi:uncharacterized membrane protein